MTTIADTLPGRLLRWRMPSTRDDRRFAVRQIAPSSAPVALSRASLPPEAVLTGYEVDGRQITPASLDTFLQANATTSFLIIRDGSLVCERYYEHDADTAHAAFSVTKSFLSALIGIALDRGYLRSVEDPVTDYVSELASHGYSDVRLKHLLSMSEGLRYSHASVPWSGAAKAYYAPDRWATVLANAHLARTPGSAWNYNDYAPEILATALRRTTGEHLAQYARRVLLGPLGMTAPASWTLDSEQAGNENAAAGLYATPRTLAAFGQLHLDEGRRSESQVIPADWVRLSTTLDDTDPPALRRVKTGFFSAARMSYKYLWWVKEQADRRDHFVAIGNLGQFIYCAPDEKTVIVRTGRRWGRFGATNWLELFEQIARTSGESPAL